MINGHIHAIQNVDYVKIRHDPIVRSAAPERPGSTGRPIDARAAQLQVTRVWSTGRRLCVTTEKQTLQGRHECGEQCEFSSIIGIWQILMVT